MMIAEERNHNQKVEKLLSGIYIELQIANNLKEREMMVKHHGEYPHLENWDVEAMRKKLWTTM